MHKGNAFELMEIIDVSGAGETVWTVKLKHLPADVAGTVYYLVTDQPLYSTPDEVVAYATGMKDHEEDDVHILRFGQNPWSGEHDAITIEGRITGGSYHIYVVLEYRGLRRLKEGVLSDR